MGSNPPRGIMTEIKLKKFTFPFVVGKKHVVIKGRYTNNFYEIEQWIVDGKEYIPWDENATGRRSPQDVYTFERAVGAAVYFKFN